MASASSSDGVAGRIQNASLVLVSDNSSTLAVSIFVQTKFPLFFF